MQLNPDPVGSTNKSMQVELLYESLLYTIGLLTFSAAVFTNYLARPNQRKKQLLISTTIPIRYYSDTEALLRFPVSLSCSRVVFCGSLRYFCRMSEHTCIVCETFDIICGYIYVYIVRQDIPVGCYCSFLIQSFNICLFSSCVCPLLA